MEPNEWKLVRKILKEGRETDPDERNEFVRRELGGDEDLTREVASLLAAEPLP